MNMDKKKISKDELKTFDSNIVSILSKQRLKNHNGNIKDYYDNRILALEVGHKIAELEIYLRNKMDFCLRKIIGKDWVKKSENLQMIKIKSNAPLQNLEHDQIISSLMLGEIVEFIQRYEILHYMFDLKNINFKKYHQDNRDFFYLNGRKTKFSNVSKVKITLNLIRNIRNRAFHWENLRKIREIQGRLYPRITHKEEGTIIGIMPEYILTFLDDLINIINNETLKRYKDVKIEYSKYIKEMGWASVRPRKNWYYDTFSIKNNLNANQ